jgi:hypothetical protein
MPPAPQLRAGCRMAPQVFDRKRTEVAEACRRLAREGLVIGTAGNVSVRAGAEAVAVNLRELARREPGASRHRTPAGSRRPRLQSPAA